MFPCPAQWRHAVEQLLKSGCLRRRPRSVLCGAGLDTSALADKQQRGEALVFGHSLSEQIGGQLEAGFVLTGFYEDNQPNPRFVIDRYLPTFLATRAGKP